MNPYATEPWPTRWLVRYLSDAEMALPVPTRVAKALLRMYRAATATEIELGAPFRLRELVLEDPDRPLWAHCGSSCRFFAQALHAYGVACELRELAYAPGSLHVVVEHPTPHGGLAYYDPLYARGLQRGPEGGARLGVAEVLEALMGADPADPYAGLHPWAPDRHAPAQPESGYAKYNGLAEDDYVGNVVGKFFNAVSWRQGGGYLHRVTLVRTSITSPSNPANRPGPGNLPWGGRYFVEAPEEDDG